MIEKNTVERWLTEVGIEFRQVEEEHEAYDWILTFKGGAFETAVAHRRVEWNHLYMQVAVTVSETHQEMLRGLDPDTRDRFMFDLRMALLDQPVGHGIENSEEDPKIPVSLTFAVNLWDEHPEKAGFMRRNHQLQSSAQLAVQMIQKLDRFKIW